MISPHISIIIPVYGCNACLFELYERLRSSLETISPDFEILLVNDASPDSAWERIQQLGKTDPRVKGINLSRNFGQHYAITAGLDHAAGEWVVVMDCDLQDQPEEIPKLYRKAREGFDIVVGRRVVRHDGFFKKLSSRLFYTVFNYVTEGKTDHTIANFGIYSKRVIQNCNHLREQNRLFPLFIKWLGFDVAYVDVEHAPRYKGNTTYNFSKAMDLAIDAIVSHSNRPLRFSIKFGFFISFVSFLYGIYWIIKYFLYDIPVEGWTSIIVSILFIGGLVFANLGLIGLYIGKVFDETKNRPLYVIKDTVGLPQENEICHKSGSF